MKLRAMINDNPVGRLVNDSLPGMAFEVLVDRVVDYVREHVPDLARAAVYLPPEAKEPTPQEARAARVRETVDKVVEAYK